LVSQGKIEPIKAFICVQAAYNILKLTNCQFENAKIKVKNAKLRNPDFVGMAIFYYGFVYLIRLF